MDDNLALAIDVSIHAPTKGATGQLYVMDEEGNVSIHAPTKGATTDTAFVVLLATEFQSTHPRRVRLARGYAPSSPLFVSIHAPTKGATTAPTFRCAFAKCFNPRTHEGCDGIKWLMTRKSNGFQSTHPRRVRRVLLWLLSRKAVFQSTHPRRVRRYCLLPAVSFSMFQSTHPRRVRLDTRQILIVLARVSIHAPTKGATHHAHPPT